tara:strand:- start:4013 stop:4216 length:204 start_codon:yes stop_codon:yes gene_type:complete
MAKVIEREKSQVGRLYSIFIFSGVLLFMANKQTLTNIDRTMLLISGSMVALTVGRAYIINKKRLDNV